MGNLQDAARKARRRLIAEWALEQGISSVALAHTQDDVAETFLMRLARGAGVDGLAAMSPVWAEGGVFWQRPLLGTSRAKLRRWLTDRGLAWAEDPSNDNLRFDRVKARKALMVLRPLGLTGATLAEVASHLAEAREALDALADHWAGLTLTEEAGSVLISVDLWRAPMETREAPDPAHHSMDRIRRIWPTRPADQPASDPVGARAGGDAGRLPLCA